ncbi:MAG: hypothetical protein ACKOXB_03985 [Flavobacteriales bacterium]
MKKYLLLLLLPVFLLLTGCPYKSYQPIDSGSAKVPKWILGRWENKSGVTYIIEKDTKYTLKAFTVDSLGNKSNNYEYVILSKVGDDVYFNVRASDNTGYYLFKLNKVNKKYFELWPFKENSPLSGTDMKKYLKNNGANSSLYNMTDVYTYTKLKR